MGDHFNENVNQLLEKSLSQMNTSLKHLSNSIKILEKVIKEQNRFTQNDIYMAKRDIESQGHSISELEKLMERKRKSFWILKR
jgi:hypothetical protein